MPRMGRAVRTCIVGGALLAAASGRAAAQTLQILPEADAHLTLNSRWKTYLQAKGDRDAGAPSQFSIGPAIQLYSKPFVRLKDVTVFDLDDAKRRALVFEAGYRYLAGPDISPYSRMEAIATFNFPLGGGFLLTDRNRADLDWESGGFEWRYRNKVTIQRTVAVGSYHVMPYVAAEPFYQSQYRRWATTRIYAGSLLPAGKHAVFNLYYVHETNTGKSPSTQTNSVGLVLNLFFSLEQR